MTREEFIEILDKKGYPYKIEGDKIVVFGVDIWLKSLTSIPPGVEFRNKRWVSLDSLTSIPHDVVFKNGGYVNLKSLTSIPPGVVFKNGEVVVLDSLIGMIGGEFDDWNSNIEGIDSKRLLNKMIKDGVFER